MNVVRMLLLIILAALASCRTEPAGACEVSDTGVVLAIDARSADYDDLVLYLRSGRFDELLGSVTASHGHLVELQDTRPYQCLSDRTFATAVQITYPPRTDEHVSAIVKIYFDADKHVRVSELSVIPKAP